MNIPGPLNVPQRLLLGPGPSNVHPRVLMTMGAPLVGHLDPFAFQMMDEIQEMLRAAFQTTNPLTFPISATGMAGMETCVVNLIEPGDKMVVCSKGFFGQRIIEVAGRAGAQVTVLEQTWGEAFDLGKIREVLQKVRPKVLGIVQAETSTGVLQPIDQLGKLCHEFDALLLIDSVTALGCVPLALDAWEVDAVYSCTQKGLSCPPGLSPVSFSPRAADAIGKRKTKVQNWYLDVLNLRKYWGPDRAYHHTGPITMFYAIREGLRLLHEEGLPTRWERHQRNHRALKAGLGALGLAYTAAEGFQLPQLNAVRIPAGIDDMKVRKQLLDEFGIEFGGGLGDFKGKVWRIGLMGFNSQPQNVLLALAAAGEMSAQPRRQN